MRLVRGASMSLVSDSEVRRCSALSKGGTDSDDARELTARITAVAERHFMLMSLLQINLASGECTTRDTMQQSV